MAEGAPLLRGVWAQAHRGFESLSLQSLLIVVMPELPEVQTVVTALDKVLRSKSFRQVSIFQAKLRSTIESNLGDNIVGQTISHVSRRAKYICIHLDHHILVVHLGMTGKLTMQPESYQLKKHDHVVFLSMIQENLSIMILVALA